MLVIASLTVGGSGRAQGPAIYTTGQNIVPAFEGWEPNSDGTFDLLFGYMNRNLTEELNIPIGPDNHIEPGGPDRGQPTYFYPRRQRFTFRVRVPKDWGKRDVVWSLTVRGITEKAYGSLLPVWEIDDKLIVANSGSGGARLDLLDRNRPPSVTVDPVPPVTLPNGATLTLSVHDDGVPAVRAPEPPTSSQETEPVFFNAPVPERPRRLRALSFTWIQFRGPGKVTFDREGYVLITNGGKAATTARFSEPGVYVLRATVSDSIRDTSQDVTVTVNQPMSRR